MDIFRVCLQLIQTRILKKATPTRVIWILKAASEPPPSELFHVFLYVLLVSGDLISLLKEAFVAHLPFSDLPQRRDREKGNESNQKEENRTKLEKWSRKEQKSSDYCVRENCKRNSKTFVIERGKIPHNQKRNSESFGFRRDTKDNNRKWIIAITTCCTVYDLFRSSQSFCTERNSQNSFDLYLHSAKLFT